MKKIYTTPVLEIESFVTEEVLAHNILSYANNNYPGYQENGDYIRFQTGSNNVLNSIDYDTFTH